MSHFKRIKHTIRTLIILTLVIYFGIIILLSIPFVQKQISHYASQELHRLFRTEVNIGNINLGLLNRIIIQNVSLQDRSGKDMLKIARFSAKVDIPSLLQGKIRINSVQLFGLNARLNKPSPDEDANFQFILNTFAKKDSTKEKSNIDLRINTILIRRGQIHYDLLSAPETPGVFNTNHIGITNLSATLALKALSNDSLNAQIRRMSFNEQCGLKLKRITLRATANHQGLQANGIEISLPKTTFRVDTLSAAYDSIRQTSGMPQDIRYMGKVQASVTLSDLSCFLPAFQHFNDPFELQFSINGHNRHIQCSDFYLTNPDKDLQLQAEALFNGERKNSSAYIFGKVSHLDINEKGFNWLHQNLTGKKDLPGILKRINYFHFNGDVSGYPHLLTMHGLIRSGAGNVQANVTMHTDTLTNAHSYSGKIKSKELRIGKLLAKGNKFGNAAFDIELKGLKYRNNQPESYIKGVISSLEYNHYEYQNITLDGQYRPGSFNGRLALDDENGLINIEGNFNTAQKTPDFNLRAIMRNFRPNALRLTDKYQNTDISLNLTADFSGHSIDDMQGGIQLDSLSVRNPMENLSYFMPNLTITAGNKGIEKEIKINSPFLQGTIQGNYSYQTISASIIKTVQRYIPSLLTAETKQIKSNNDFRFDLKMENSDLLSKVIGIPLDLKMPATLNGYFNDSLTRLKVNGYFPEFTYNNTRYESGTILCENPGNQLQCKVRANMMMKKGSMLNLSLNANAKDDRLHTTVNWGNNTNVTYSGEIDAIASFNQSADKKQIQTYIDILPSRVVLNDTTWHIHPAAISIAKDSIEINDFLFEHQDQYLRINGRLGKTSADSCLVNMKNINLLYIMDMIQFHAVKFYGLTSGKVSLYHILNEPVMLAKLNVKDFSLNDALLGQADITGSWDKELGGVRLLADIREDSLHTTMVNGYVSPKLKGLDLHIQAGGTTLAFLQPFVKSIFTDVRGRAHGNVRLYGPFSGLDLEGDVKANMGMKVNILNTRFEAQADSVHITSGQFKFQNVQLTDAEGNHGTAQGTLRHTKLKNLAYQFAFNTNNMLVYNTSRETPDFPFYGRIYTTGDVSIRGGDNALNVDGNMRADRNTAFAYVLGTAAEATNNQFITFVDRTPKRKQEIIQTEVYHYLNRPEEEEDDDTPLDVHINLQIEPTSEANMKIIMDPAAGDYISATGTGNLRINFFNKGDFQIFGNYNIAQGIYKMSMQNVIRKDFTLQPGGIVTFNGNPKAANLNVQAVYTVNSASLNDLIANATSSKGNVRVNCLLNLTGNLTSPNLTFDLELPTVNEEDRELVRSLTSTEEQMNTQIIYLLSVGKFYAYDYNNASQSDATSSLAFSTLSGQLNNMLSQVIDSQNWNLGTNLTTGEKGWSDVEAEAILSGRMLNNRLIINGNFGYRENTMRNTNFVGDFEAIWLLSKNGDFRLRGYNQTNDRYFTKSTLTTQGIGIMYNKDFSNWKELIDWFLRRRKLRTSRQKKNDEEKYSQPQTIARPADEETTSSPDKDNKEN